MPLVFVINKSDVVIQSSEKKKYEENSEFILAHLRALALEYGATITYTSGKTNTNLTILYDYICHILFNFDLAHKPNLIDKEAYFLPAGYDNLPLLESNAEQNKYKDEEYQKKINPPVKKIEKQEEDIQCEDTNTFFESLKTKGAKGRDQNIGKNKISGSLNEYKKNNFNMPDMRNFETNIPMARNPISLNEKEKKFTDTRQALKEKLGNRVSVQLENTDNINGKENSDAKKQKIRQEMLAKIAKAKAKKKAEKAEEPK